MDKLIKILIILFFTSLFCPVFAETVIYNPKSGIYHNVNCASGIRCKSCIKINKKIAVKKGRACKKCGG